MEGVITNLVIVADKGAVPPGYEVIEKSADKGEECDLWKDHFFGKRITRYIAITRSLNQAEVALGDLCVLEERQSQPTGFSAVEQTWDTREKALQKKTLHVKWLPLSQTRDAVTDVCVLTRAKVPPKDYQIAGNINNTTICFKYGPVGEVGRAAGQFGALSLSQEMFQKQSDSSPLPYSTQPNGVPLVPQRQQSATPRRPAPPVPSTPPYAGVASGSSSAGFTLHRQHSTLTRLRADSGGAAGGGIDDYLWAIRGVPFDVNPRISIFQRLENFYIPDSGSRTSQEMNVMYEYNFEKEIRCMSNDYN